MKITGADATTRSTRPAEAAATSLAYDRCPLPRSFPRSSTRSAHSSLCDRSRSLAACGKEAPPPARQPRPRCGVVTIEPQTIPYTPVFVAQTESSRQVNIVARVSGFLDSIAYQEGELVKQGQLMFKLDPKPFQAQLNAAQGELQAQQARLATAEVDLSTASSRWPSRTRCRRSTSIARRASSTPRRRPCSPRRPRSTRRKLNLGYATITSPVTGVASRALQRQGAYVNALADSANLTYVAALDPIWVNFSISQNQMARFQELRATRSSWSRPRTTTSTSSSCCPTASSIRTAARSASPIRRSARTRDRSWCAR